MSEFIATGTLQLRELIKTDGSGTVSCLPQHHQLVFQEITTVEINAPISPSRNNIEIRGLNVKTDGESIEEAHEKIYAALEWISDYVAFMMLSPVYWQINNIFDTASKRGQAGTLASMRNPKWFSSKVMGNGRIAPLKTIKLSTGLSEKTLAALRWYHKGLAANYDIDRFIAYWVALELLAPLASEAVNAPREYMRSRNCDCRPIQNCPSCGVSTEYQPGGPAPSVTRYLMDVCGYTKKTARELSSFRQALHGSGRLTLTHMGHSGAMVDYAQKAVCMGIKEKLGMAMDDTPVLPAGFIMGCMLNPLSQQR